MINPPPRTEQSWAFHGSKDRWGRDPNGTFLTATPMPERVLYLEPLHRRMGVELGGSIVARSDSNLIWYVQVAALVVAHVTGLVLGHDTALAVYGGVKRAALSQRWMLLMMVTFTCLGLYLLSRANG